MFLEFGNTGISYIVQALILGQPLFFVALYDWKQLKIPPWVEPYLYLAATCALLVVKLTHWEIMFYTNNLWVQYIIMVVTSYAIYRDKYPIKEAGCLAFLTVFLNSFYWETPLHLADFITGAGNILGNLGVWIPQLWRLYPATFFLPRFNYKPTAKKKLLAGLVFSAAIMGLIFGLHIVGPMKQLYYLVNRFVCMIILTQVTLEAEPKTAETSCPKPQRACLLQIIFFLTWSIYCSTDNP